MHQVKYGPFEQIDPYRAQMRHPLKCIPTYQSQVIFEHDARDALGVIALVIMLGTKIK